MEVSSLDSIATTWTFVGGDNKKIGPFELSRCQQLYKEGSLTRGSNVWSWDDNKWIQIKDMSSLFNKLEGIDDDAGTEMLCDLYHDFTFFTKSDSNTVSYSVRLSALFGLITFLDTHSMLFGVMRLYILIILMY